MSDDDIKKQLEQFRSWHDEAYLYINQGITQEKPEIDRPDVALMMYQKGLGMLDMAMCVDTESGTGPAWEKARKMQQKMTKTRSHVESRIYEITEKLTSPETPQQSSRLSVNVPPPRPSPPGVIKAPSRPDAPPSYADAIAGPASAPPPPYTPVIDLTNDPEPEPAGGIPRSATSDSVSSSEQGEILFSLEGVQVFHVTSSGEVTTPSYPETLHIIKFDREYNRKGAELPPAFLEVGQWTYPLLKGKSPILKADYGIDDVFKQGKRMRALSLGGYMFPDLEKENVTGGAVGILMPDTATDVDREIFESIIAEITTAFKTQEEVEQEYAEYREFSSTLASGLVKGAEAVGKGMVKGAVKTSELLVLWV